METNYLIHHGIKGQKWGVRRTAEQLGHRVGNKTETFFGNHQAKKMRKQDIKKRRIMSDAELEKKILRMKNERILKDMAVADLYPVRKTTVDFVKRIGGKTLSTVATGAALYAVKAYITGEINVKEAASYMTPRPKNK